MVLSGLGVWWNSWDYRQSNQNELTQKGDKHKRKKQSPKAEQQAQRSKQSELFPCQSRWLGWRRVGPAAAPTAQRRCRRTGRVATSSFGTVTSFWNGLSCVSSVVLRSVLSSNNKVDDLIWFRRFGVLTHRRRSGGGNSVVSQSPDGRRSVQTVVGAAQSVTRPLTGDNCTVRAHWIAVSFVDLAVVYQ